MILTHVRNFVQGFLSGILGVLAVTTLAYIVAYAWFAWITAPAGSQVGIDIVSFFVFYSRAPTVWLMLLLVFAMGFYLSLKRKLAR
ncbi:MAG TPA: hypothetical protein VEG32_07465 [Clostridia bacterium]|nr:hypothetical protein [Clostridia bacterium]